MKLRIMLFAGLAQAAGKPETMLESDCPITAQELKDMLAERYPSAASLLAVSFVARNQAYAARDTLLTEGDEIAVIPPVSGGQSQPSGPSKALQETDSRYFITDKPLSVEDVTRRVIDPLHGAVLTFTGTTREFTAGKRTVRLEYEAYTPMAVKTLRQIGDEIGTRWPGTRCAIAHRTGPVGIGEISVVIAVSSQHRGDGYEASRYAIERLKQIVPIWKKEVWEDGTEWKGHQLGPWNPSAPIPPSVPSVQDQA
jgi:molybdopterin converting factor subunit 1